MLSRVLRVRGTRETPLRACAIALHFPSHYGSGNVADIEMHCSLLSQGSGLVVVTVALINSPARNCCLSRLIRCRKIACSRVRSCRSQGCAGSLLAGSQGFQSRAQAPITDRGLLFTVSKHKYRSLKRPFYSKYPLLQSIQIP